MEAYAAVVPADVGFHGVHDFEPVNSAVIAVGG
jgi:hypothetical protein